MAQVERRAENVKDAKNARRAERKVRTERAEFVGFVNFKPNAQEKAEFQGWLADLARVTTDCEDCLEDGWKIGFTRDRDDGIYVATIARWDGGHPEAGIILNARTTDVLFGHCRVVYALVYVYEHKLSPHVVGRAGDDLF